MILPQAPGERREVDVDVVRTAIIKSIDVYPDVVVVDANYRSRAPPISNNSDDSHKPIKDPKCHCDED